MTDFAIIDCGIGNLRSVQKIFQRLGTDAPITREAAVIIDSDGIVLPGVGAFGDAMRGLEESGTADLLRAEAGERGKPILGICLGMQLFARSSEESPGVAGLGLVPAEVVRLDVSGRTDWMERKLTLPHIGWNTATPRNGTPLFDGIGDGADFYFVHSYQMIMDDPSWVAATAQYGEEFVAAIDNGTLCAVQFHPEKSQTAGQTLIRNFIARTERAAAAA